MMMILILLWQDLMLEADSDDSGTIDFPEFLALMAKVVQDNNINIFTLYSSPGDC